MRFGVGWTNFQTEDISVVRGVKRVFISKKMIRADRDKGLHFSFTFALFGSFW